MFDELQGSGFLPNTPHRSRLIFYFSAHLQSRRAHNRYPFEASLLGGIALERTQLSAWLVYWRKVDFLCVSPCGQVCVGKIWYDLELSVVLQRLCRSPPWETPFVFLNSTPFPPFSGVMVQYSDLPLSKKETRVLRGQGGLDQQPPHISNLDSFERKDTIW